LPTKKARSWSGQTRALILLDANMPPMDDCDGDCIDEGSHLCMHRFGCPVEIIKCDSSGLFRGVPDSDVVLYFIHLIISKADTFLLEPDVKSLFIILTRDKDFIEDAQKEWKECSARKKRLNPHLKVEFYNNHIEIRFMTFFFDLMVVTVAGDENGACQSQYKNRQSAIKLVNDILFLNGVR